jgi:hypothetical protein
VSKLQSVWSFHAYVAGGWLGTALLSPELSEIGVLSAPDESLSAVTDESKPSGPSAQGRPAPEPHQPGAETKPAAFRDARRGASRTASGRARDPMAKLLDQQHGVLARKQAREFGIGSSTLAYRTQQGGPWRRLFPGVYLTDRGTPTVDQLDMAALLYAGDASLLTGRAALRRYRILPSATGIVDVLVPTGTGLADRGYVRIHRTRRMPGIHFQQAAIRFAAMPRAVTDAALGASTMRDMRAIVCLGVDRGGCALEDLTAELGRSRLRNSAILRTVIADVARGIRSVPEGDLMDLIDSSDLPMPLFNPRLYVDGAFLAAPDAWWEPFGVAAEVDSREYHFEEADWEHTMQRHARMTAVGIRVLHFTPRRIQAQPELVISTIRQTLQVGKPVAGLRTVRSD